jgi:hypothetical protein
VPFRQGHRDLTVGAPVQLRRTSRTGPTPPGQPAELRDEQAVRDQLVQVELRRVPSDAGTGGRLVAADGIRLVDDVQVEVAANRLGEGCHPGHAAGEVVGSHPGPSKRQIH